jgi:hypothetical protein
MLAPAELPAAEDLLAMNCRCKQRHRCAGAVTNTARCFGGAATSSFVPEQHTHQAGGIERLGVDHLSALGNEDLRVSFCDPSMTISVSCSGHDQ